MDAFSDIALFALIDKLGSMAAAAQELGVTPPVITRRLANLEKRLGVRLMNRTTRKISLTPEGELYLIEGAKVLEAMNELEGRIGGASKQPHGTIRIASTLGFGRRHLAPILSKFIEKHPQIDVQLHLSDRLINIVDQGFDVMVKFGDLTDSRLTARLLAKNCRILCAAPAYLAKKGVPAHPRDLGKHNCIFIREADETYGTWHLRNGSDNLLVKVRSNLSTNDGSSALGWALDGRGILYRSQWEVAPFLRSKELIPVLPDWCHPAADIHLIFQASKQMPAKTRTLVDWLLEAFKMHRKQTKNVSGTW